jgi:hypothetical protein
LLLWRRYRHDRTTVNRLDEYTSCEDEVEERDAYLVYLFNGTIITIAKSGVGAALLWVL